MAALLRSAVPEEAAPRAEFAAELQARLEQEVQQPSRTRHLPFLAKQPQGRARVSRRAVLAGGVPRAAPSSADRSLLAHVDYHAATATSRQYPKHGPTPPVPASTAPTRAFVRLV